MSKRCFHCKKRNADPAGCGEHTFSYKDLQFRIFRSGGSCNQCEEGDEIKKFERLPAGLITPVEGDLPKVDWNMYVELHDSDLRDEHGGPFDQATRIFMHLGLLVYPEHNDCWILTGCGMNLGPLLPLFGGLGFAREEDAVAYAQIKYARSAYAVFVSSLISSRIVNKKPKDG